MPLHGEVMDHPLVRKMVATVKPGLLAREKAGLGMEKAMGIAEKALEIKNAHTFVPLPHAGVPGNQASSESLRSANSL